MANVFYPSGDSDSGASQVFQSRGPDSTSRTNLHPARDLLGKAIVSMDTGAKVGELDDILFDPTTLQAAGLVCSQGGLFNRSHVILPASEVHVWGKDVILLRSGTPIEGQEASEKWVNLSEQLHGRYVVSTEGTRVGQVDDVLVNPQGGMAGYRLSQVFIEGPLSESKIIPIGATQSLGKDVLIVDMNRFQG